MSRLKFKSLLMGYIVFIWNKNKKVFNIYFLVVYIIYLFESRFRVKKVRFKERERD